jgi:anti-sigma factor RsiW
MKNTACTAGIDVLMEYFEGALSAEERAAVEAHAAGCPGCVAFVASYRETPRIVRHATAIDMPADLETSLLATLRAVRLARPPSDD